MSIKQYRERPFRAVVTDAYDHKHVAAYLRLKANDRKHVLRDLKCELVPSSPSLQRSTAIITGVQCNRGNSPNDVRERLKNAYHREGSNPSISVTMDPAL